MNEIKAVSALVGANEEKVKGLVKGFMEMAMDKGATLAEFAAAMEAIFRMGETEYEGCISVKEVYDKFLESETVNFPD